MAEYEKKVREVLCTQLFMAETLDRFPERDNTVAE